MRMRRRDVSSAGCRSVDLTHHHIPPHAPRVAARVATMLAEALEIVGWIVLGPPVATLLTVVAGRLLGARRGWVALIASGIIGFAAAVVAAGEVTGWDWNTLDMVLVAMLLGMNFTMSVALALDLVAPSDRSPEGRRRDSSPCTTRSPGCAAPSTRCVGIARCWASHGPTVSSPVGSRTRTCRRASGARSRRRAGSSSSSARWPRRAATCCREPGATSWRRCAVPLPRRRPS